MRVTKTKELREAQETKSGESTAAVHDVAIVARFCT